MLANPAFLVLGLIPLGLSCLFWRALAPIEGLCPLDIFHVYLTPSPEDLWRWRLGSGIAVGALLVLAIFKRPFGLVFLAVESVAFVVLLVRLAEAQITRHRRQHPVVDLCFGRPR